VPKFSLNFEEMRPRTCGNFEEKKNKILVSSTIIIDYCIIFINP